MIFNLGFGQKTQDTLFIKKQRLKGAHQSIFFEQNKTSKYYVGLTDFSFGDDYKDTYNYSLTFLKSNRIKLIHKKTILPSKKWITLKQYNNKYYAYYPCDFYTYYKCSVNDSTYIDWSGEGPIANKIIEQKKLDNKTYLLKLTGQHEKYKILIIHIIDSEKGIAIFEERRKKNVVNYYLMIMAEKINEVPLIVNNCLTEKQIELTFQQPNFKILINKK
ncbi:MAG: hypothetical protein H7221_07990 [Flavobacterium sp.]|nr:hypothetical protein [Flavobacterium sp.]